jgi:hypothetical protein
LECKKEQLLVSNIERSGMQRTRTATGDNGAIGSSVLSLKAPDM